MVPLVELWLPILLSTVFVFIASTLAWTVLPHHKKDTRGLRALEDEAISLTQKARDLGMGPGKYIFPNVYEPPPSAGEGKAAVDAQMKKMNETGCVGTLTIFPGPPNMARNMLLTLAAFAVMALFVAYIAGNGLGRGERYLDVYQLVGAAAFAAHCFGGWANGIWFGKPTRAFITEGIDAFVYANITAGTFAWLWPQVVA